MERLYLPKLNRLHPTLESTVLKVVEESGELARAVLQHLADPAAKTPDSMDEVAAELLDVAQTCVTMIFVLEDEYGLRCANVFHAGDGNLHPLILFDSNKPDDVERAEKFGAAILELCVQVGGTVTGEHGVGHEKLRGMCVQFDSEELSAFHRVKAAFDPQGLLNPGKAVPTLHRCAEFGRMHVHRGELKFPEIERF